MPAWPNSTGITTANLDSGTDSPATARGDLAVAVGKVKDVIDARGAADGVCPLGADGKIPAGYLPVDESGDGTATMTFAARQRIFITAGTFTFAIPTGVTRIGLEMWGAGGGGGRAGSGSAGGGGNGGGVIRTVGVTDVEELTIVVGAGGSAGDASTVAGDGADSTVTYTRDGGSPTTITAPGGKGGVSDIGAGAVGTGAGGVGTDGTVMRGARGLVTSTGGLPGFNGRWGHGGEGSVGGTAGPGRAGAVAIFY